MVGDMEARIGTRRSFWRRFAGDRNGNIAMMFGLAAIPFFLATGAAVDIGRMMQVKNRLSNALDATALAVASRRDVTQAQADQIAQAYFAANYDPSEIGNPSTPVVTLTREAVTVTATASLDTLIMGLAGINEVDVRGEAEVIRSGNNLEVALVLDVTGSMGSPITKIQALRAAATDLVNIVVRDEQTPFFSKVTLVPYSMGVNVGSYADAVRGPAAPTRFISGISKTTSYLQITTTSNHGFVVGQRIYFSGINGMTQLNGKTYLVSAVPSNTQFRIAVNGNTVSNYSSGGAADCTVDGCKYNYYQSADGNYRLKEISNCVSERIGGQAYTEVTPSSTAGRWVGRVYPFVSGDNVCNTSTIIPLTANRTTLNTSIANLRDEGFTGGHIGIAWGRYMLAPTWGSLWPAAENRPLPYNSENLIKVAVIMTDGEFNTAFAQGVPAAGPGNDQRINASPTNGTSLNQGARHCTELKANNVVVYTVGFQINNTAANFLQTCASGTSRFYRAESAEALREAFRNIAIEISNLRISR